MFLGETPVEVEITQMTCLESNPHAHWNPYLYTIQVTHGEYKWTVKKRYNQFLKLHTAIMLSGRDTDDVRTKNFFANFIVFVLILKRRENIVSYNFSYILDWQFRKYQKTF